MPTYEYKCSDCENVQEEVHSISITPMISCKICGGSCKRIISMNGNFILKGSDWPSQSFKMKDDMTKKNARMKTKMVEREKSGEGVSKVGDLVKN
jgi:putative FmdB family regulatory protein